MGIPFLIHCSSIAHLLSEHSVPPFLTPPCKALFGLVFALCQVFPNPFPPLSPAGSPGGRRCCWLQSWHQELFAGMLQASLRSYRECKVKQYPWLVEILISRTAFLCFMNRRVHLLCICLVSQLTCRFGGVQYLLPTPYSALTLSSLAMARDVRARDGRGEWWG